MGPLIFLAYMDDLPESIRYEVFYYAVDANIIVSDCSSRKLYEKTRTVLIDFAAHCQKNSLIVNSQKIIIVEIHTKCRAFKGVSFSFNGDILNSERKLKFLRFLE